MSGWTGPIAAVAAIALFSGPANAQGDLFLYNWTDYTSPELIEKFESETGIDVTIDSFDTNETLLAKLKSGNATYDVVVPSHNFVSIMIQEGLLQPINAQEMDGYENIDARWRDPDWDPGNRYSIPWQWGTTSFAVDTDVYAGDIDTYEVLFEPPSALQGSIGMMNSPDDVINMALIYLGEPTCNQDPETMQEVLELLQAQKPHVKVYNSDGIKERMVSGDTAMHMMWNGYAMRAKAEKPSIDYAFADEGVITWMDNLVVPKHAENPENAKRFIEFMLQPENAAIQSNFARYANGIAGSSEYLDEDLTTSAAFETPPGVENVFVDSCPKKSIDLYSRVWTKLLQ
jgi:spermidine/putrescine transport system substrate-binding protein